VFRLLEFFNPNGINRFDAAIREFSASVRDAI
jgi:hypothetical protein